MLPPQPVQRLVIASLTRFLARGLDIAHLRLDHALLGSDRRMMFVGLDAERLAQRGQQMVLVQLGVALDRLAPQAARELAEFGDRFLLQLLVGVRHGEPPERSPSYTIGRARVELDRCGGIADSAGARAFKVRGNREGGSTPVASCQPLIAGMKPAHPGSGGTHGSSRRIHRRHLQLLRSLVRALSTYEPLPRIRDSCRN